MREVFSNTVVTTVSQVDGLTLVTDNQTKIANPGSLVYFPHTVTNTGNGTDTYTLAPAQLTSDDFDLTSFAIYLDANQDGLPDNYTAITSTGPLGPGAQLHVVLVGQVSASQAVDKTAKVTITATSTLAGGSGSTQTNTDTVTVVSGPVMQVTKAVSQPSGYPDDAADIKYTITYTNSGNATATNFKITDVVPTGLVYQTGTGHWSVTGATALPSDNAATTTTGPDTSTITYDYGATAAGTVTAVISSVPAGASGYITFVVHVQSEVWFRDTQSMVLPKILNNTADFTFTEATGTYTTNVVPFTVLQAAHETFTGDNEPTDNSGNELGTPGTPSTYVAPAGSTVVFRNVLKNTGTGIDTFDVTYANAVTGGFPAGTSFQLFKSDGQTPLVDSNGNGTPDTGPLAPNATYTVVLKAILPASASGTGGFAVTKTATSAFDPTVTQTVTDSINAITGANVDLTNNSSGSLAPGYGPGPETSAVVTNDGAANDGTGAGIAPGTTTTFTLYVTNTGPFADSFDLLASSSASFGTSSSLPTGWTVVFKKSGVSVSNTGSLQPTTSAVITAEVTVPAGIAPDAYPVYFQSKSPTSGAADIIHDAVKVKVVRGLVLQTDNVGQTFPGGSVVYAHTLTNTGNVTEGAGGTGSTAGSTLALGLTNSFTGFTSVVYYDTNGNGVLDNGEPIVTGNLDAVRSAGILAGQTVHLLVKVTAPLGAGDGTSNLTKLTVTPANVGGGAYDASGTYVSSAPAVMTNTDTTGVVSGDLSITKEQALDADNDGEPDSSYVTTQLSAPPGTRIIYRVTVTNTGSADATAIVVNDTVPANTTYSAVTGKPATAQVAGGTVNTVTGPDASGAFSFNVGTLTPTQSAIITFGVKINN